MLPLFPPPVNSCGTRARAWHALQARGGYGSGGAPKSSGSRGGRPRPHRISRPRTSAFSALHAGRFGFVAPACCFSHKRMHWHPRKPQGKTKRQGFSTVRRRRRLMRDAAPCAFALCANLAAPLRCAARRGEHTCTCAHTRALAGLSSRSAVWACHLREVPVGSTQGGGGGGGGPVSSSRPFSPRLGLAWLVCVYLSQPL